MTYQVYLLLGVLAIVCIFLICLFCIDRFYDALYDPAPPPCKSADWQEIERQSRAIQDKAQAEFKSRPPVTSAIKRGHVPPRPMPQTSACTGDCSQGRSCTCSSQAGKGAACPLSAQRQP